MLLSDIKNLGGRVSPPRYGKRSFSRGMTMSRIEPSPRVKAAPRTRATGRPAVLPRVELGGGGQLVGDGAHGRAHDPAVGVGRAAEVLERQQPGHADRHVDDAPAPRPAERIGDDDRDVDPEPRADGRAGCAPADRSGSTGSRVTSEPEAGPTFDASIAAVGAHEPVRASR